MGDLSNLRDFFFQRRRRRFGRMPNRRLVLTAALLALAVAPARGRSVVCNHSPQSSACALLSSLPVWLAPARSTLL